jgi:hypothetical protein
VGELPVAQADQVPGGKRPGRDVVEGHVAQRPLAGPRGELGDPPCRPAVARVVEVGGGHLGVAVDDRDVQALLDGPAQQPRPPRRRHRDELGDLLGQEHVQGLGLQVLAALGGEEQRLVAQVAGAGLDAEHDIADVAVADALHHDADQRTGLRAEPPGRGGRAVLHPLGHVVHGLAGGQADAGIVLERAADRGRRHPERGGHILHRDPAGHDGGGAAVAAAGLGTSMMRSAFRSAPG